MINLSIKKLGIIFRQIRTLAQYRFILNLFCVNSFRGVFWMGELDTWIIDCLSPIGHQFKLFYSVYLSEPSTPWFLHADLSVKLIISFFKLVNFGVLSIDICFFFSFSFFVFLFVVNLGSLTLQLAGSPYDLYSNYINAMYVCCLQWFIYTHVFQIPITKYFANTVDNIFTMWDGRFGI